MIGSAKYTQIMNLDDERQRIKTQHGFASQALCIKVIRRKVNHGKQHFISRYSTYP